MTYGDLRGDKLGLVPTPIISFEFKIKIEFKIGIELGENRLWKVKMRTIGPLMMCVTVGIKIGQFENEFE